MDTAATRSQLRAVLTGSLGEQSTQQAIEELAALNPAQFCTIGISVLEALPDSPERTRAFVRLLECQTFLKELLQIGRYSDEELKRLCADWMVVDRFLDVRLARLAPGRHEDQVKLPPELVGRLLDVLHHISPGPRVIILVNHLKHHTNLLIAEKATLLVGRRIRNLGWIKQRLASTDARIRAAAVESLWGTETASARVLLRQSRGDEDGRVAANALIGFHLLGEINAHQWVREMACDGRPSFRRWAVWAMGQMGEPEFLEPLRAALADSEVEVRINAKQALVALRRIMPETTAPAAEPEVAPSLEPEEPAAPAAPEPDTFRFRFDGSFIASWRRSTK